MRVRHTLSALTKPGILISLQFLSVFATLALFTSSALSTALSDEDSITQRVRSEEEGGALNVSRFFQSRLSSLINHAPSARQTRMQLRHALHGIWMVSGSSLR